MSQTKAQEIRELTVDELGDRLRELKQEALNLRLQQATGQLENTARIGLVRTETARVLTILSERRKAKAKAAE